MCTTGAFFSLLQSPLFYFEAQSDEMAFYVSPPLVCLASFHSVRVSPPPQVNLFCAFMTALSWLNPLCLGITALQKSLLRKEDAYAERLLKAKRDREAIKL